MNTVACQVFMEVPRIICVLGSGGYNTRRNSEVGIHHKLTAVENC